MYADTLTPIRQIQSHKQAHIYWYIDLHMNAHKFMGTHEHAHIYSYIQFAKSHRWVHGLAQTCLHIHSHLHIISHTFMNLSLCRITPVGFLSGKQLGKEYFSPRLLFYHVLAPAFQHIIGYKCLICINVRLVLLWFQFFPLESKAQRGW